MMDGEVERLSGEVLSLSVRLAEAATLLTIAVRYAWLDTWMHGCRQMAAALDDQLRRQARTDRLIRRGVPAAAAAQGLHVV